MRYCPKCDVEYRDTVKTCSDDGAHLLEAAEYAAAAARARKTVVRGARLISVSWQGDRFEAEELARGLVEEGIDAAVASNQTRSFRGAATPGPEMFSIVVPDVQAARATALLSVWRPGLEAQRPLAELEAEVEERMGEQHAAM
jgi:hypothetical protein